MEKSRQAMTKRVRMIHGLKQASFDFPKADGAICTCRSEQQVVWGVCKAPNLSTRSNGGMAVNVHGWAQKATNIQCIYIGKERKEGRSKRKSTWKKGKEKRKAGTIGIALHIS